MIVTSLGSMPAKSKGNEQEAVRGRTRHEDHRLVGQRVEIGNVLPRDQRLFAARPGRLHDDAWLFPRKRGVLGRHIVDSQP